MPGISVYIDTSALLKWYIREPNSDEVEAFLIGHPGIYVSRLTRAEFRCALARRRRSGQISAALEVEAFRLFESHLLDGVLTMLPLRDSHVARVPSLIDDLPDVPLRTLDATHLAIAVDSKADLIATADKIMAQAAQQLGLQVEQFFA